MDSPGAPVIVSASGQWFVGKLLSHGERIQDILRDTNSSFITLSDVQICRPAEGEWCRATLHHVIVLRHEIEFVTVPPGRHEAPIKRYNNYEVRKTIHCVFTLGQYCIQGDVHVPVVHDDVAYTFLSQLGSFFPITNACLSTTGIEQLTVPVLFANKQHVSCFSLGPLVVNDELANEPTSKSAAEGIEMGIDRLLTLIDSFKTDSQEQFFELR
jgi:hypothetical protein